jgi:hypothetical protein
MHLEGKSCCIISYAIYFSLTKDAHTKGDVKLRGIIFQYNKIIMVQDDNMSAHALVAGVQIL